MCSQSLYKPWHNEWVNIWLYLGFALYFWIQLILIGTKYKNYDFNNDTDYVLMFIATLGVALSLTVTAVYLCYYPISKDVKARLENFNYQGILVLAYCILFAFLGSEWASRQPIGFYFMFLTAIALIVTLAMVQYESLKTATYWITGIFGGLIILIDLCAYATKRQAKVFYIPLVIELLVFGIGILIVVFRIPERWAKNRRGINLYFNSQIIYTIFLINFLYELLNILYFTFKANSGNLEDDDTWWYTKNIYH